MNNINWKAVSIIILLVAAIVMGIWIASYKISCTNFDKGQDVTTCAINCKAAKCNFYSQNGEEWCQKLCQENYSYHKHNSNNKVIR